MRCKIVSYSRVKSFGFADSLENDERYFFHETAIADMDGEDFRNLVPGQIVEGYDPVYIEGKSLRVLSKLETKLHGHSNN